MKLNDLMQKKWMVGSFEGHAIFWNHASTFATYAISDNGDAIEVDVNTSIPPVGMNETDKIRWAIEQGRFFAAQKGQHNGENEVR